VRTADSGLALRLEIPFVRAGLPPALDDFHRQLHIVAASLVVPPPDPRALDRLLTEFAGELARVTDRSLTIEVLHFGATGEAYAVAHELGWIPDGAPALVGLDSSSACRHSWECAAFRTNSRAESTALARHLARHGAATMARVSDGAVGDWRPGTLVAMGASADLIFPGDRCPGCRDLLAEHVVAAAGGPALRSERLALAALAERAVGAWIIDPERGVGEVTSIGGAPIAWNEVSGQFSRALRELIGP
jgi:hypothetical protein